jgi:transketolase C-terminal domain/subunit
VTLITYGSLLDNVLDAADILSEQGIQARVLRFLNVAPLPLDAVISKVGDCRRIVIAEETAAGSGIRHDLASAILERLPECRVSGMDLGNEFVTHGSKQELYTAYGLDAQAIAEFTKGVLNSED